VTRIKNNEVEVFTLKGEAAGDEFLEVYSYSTLW
jgi:hypothetical protein